MKKRVMSIVLALALMLTLLPAALAEGNSVTVYVTVSDMGGLAVGSDGTLMAQVPVSVPAEGGTATADAVLSAVHDKYSKGGYAIKDGFVNRLWGRDTSNLMFFVNDRGLMESVTKATVSSGDCLTAAILKDGTLYSDYYAYFSERTVSACVGENVVLKLMGYSGMAGGTAAPLSGIDVGTAANGAFSQISGAVTDSSGSVTLSFSQAGTYCVTASGTVASTAYDYAGKKNVDVNAPIVAPACLITVTAAPEHPFADVNDPSQAGAVDYVYKNNIMKGVSDVSFDPDAATTRAMAATALWSLAGKPAPGGEGFADTRDGWFSPAAAWAKETGVSAGCGNGLFDPDEQITRQELAAMLYAFDGAKPADADLSVFADAGSADGWAVPALKWTVSNGFLDTKSGALAPNGPVSRAQFAAVLEKYCRAGK